MSFPNLALAYLLTTLVFFAIDIVWLGLIAKNLYQRLLGDLLAENVNWPVALLFYLLYIIGIFIFAILPAAEQQSLFKAALLGGLFGFFTYATYDLTNLATLRNWPASIVVIDIIWGVFLTATVSISGYYIVQFVCN